MKIGAINSITISHLHMDHFLDFATLLCNVATYDHKQPITIYGPKATEDLFSKLIAFHDFDNDLSNFFNQYCKIQIIGDGDKWQIGDDAFKAYSVEHGGIEAYAIGINGILAYTGDSALCDNVKQIAKEYQYVICDCSLMEGNYKHLGIDQIDALADEYPTTTFIPTHFRDEVRDHLRTHNPHNFLIPDDGSTFKV